MNQKLFFLIISIFVFLNPSIGQNNENKIKLQVSDSKFDIAAGMGLKILSIPDVVSYINTFHPYEFERDGSIAAEFYFCPEIQIDSDLSLKIDYTYVIKTYNKDITNDQLSISLGMNLPSLIIHYLIKGEGYFVKIGGGLGYYFLNLEQKFLIKNEEVFSSNGIGLKFDFAGHTMLGKNIYAAIGVNLQTGFLGEFKNKSDNPLFIRDKITGGFLGGGLNLGLGYYF